MPLPVCANPSLRAIVEVSQKITPDKPLLHHKIPTLMNRERFHMGDAVRQHIPTAVQQKPNIIVQTP